MTPTPTATWLGELGFRLRLHWLLKITLISLVVAAFMVFYLWLQRHPQFPVTIMPRLPAGERVPFVPWAIVPYLSLWLYIGLAPGLMRSLAELPAYALSVVLLAAVACGFFIFTPTAVPPSPIDWSPWPVIDAIKTADAGRNACPSLHVGFSVLTSIWLTRLLHKIGTPGWLHVLNIAWCLMILWSTVATRQHVLLDIAGGVPLGAAAALLAPWLWRQYRPPRFSATDDAW